MSGLEAEFAILVRRLLHADLKAVIANGKDEFLALQ